MDVNAGRGRRGASRAPRRRAHDPRPHPPPGPPPASSRTARRCERAGCCADWYDARRLPRVQRPGCRAVAAPEPPHPDLSRIRAPGPPARSATASSPTATRSSPRRYARCRARLRR
ncbi:MAG: hypothetical protein MZW92_79510 [Comamonadaceae bacterium]|nr:hypothetical protein [Comamonadaceae bacterium]